MDITPQERFITRYKFQKDRSKPDRSLQSVKVGDVYISRVVIDPYGMIGNVYYKETNIVFFVERGRLNMKCRQMHTNQETEMVIQAGDGVVHLPPFIAIGLKNLEGKSAVLIMISNKPLRSGDEYNSVVYDV